MSTKRQPAPGENGRPAGTGALRILLVEDDMLISMSTADMLEMLGHTVFAAPGATGALDLLGREQIDLLFTDLGLPDMPGWELARAARERNASLPVILATGYDSVPGDGEVPHSILLGKPYDIADIERAIDRVIAREGAGRPVA